MTDQPAGHVDNADKAATRRFADATPLLANPDELAAQAERDGYLFFRGLLPEKPLLTIRRQMLEILQRWDLLDKDADLMEGLADERAADRHAFDPARGSDGIHENLYFEIQKLELFHKAAHEPALLNVFRSLFRTETFPHPKTIARIVLPGSKPTPPHQDFIHNQGTPNTWTAWFPLGDCPRELGGISVLEGSHHSGIIHVAAQEGAGGLESILCGMDLEWAEGDYRLGDVILFDSRTVHKALPQTVGNRIRLSCDFRYQPAHEPLDPKSLLSHGRYEWEKIYAGWTDTALQYYWKNCELKFSVWDESIRWQKEKIC